MMGLDAYHSRDPKERPNKDHDDDRGLVMVFNEEPRELEQLLRLAPNMMNVCSGPWRIVSLSTAGFAPDAGTYAFQQAASAQISF